MGNISQDTFTKIYHLRQFSTWDVRDKSCKWWPDLYIFMGYRATSFVFWDTEETDTTRYSVGFIEPP